MTGDRNVYQYGRPVIPFEGSDIELQASLPLKNEKGVQIGTVSTTLL